MVPCSEGCGSPPRPAERTDSHRVDGTTDGTARSHSHCLHATRLPARGQVACSAPTGSRDGAEAVTDRQRQDGRPALRVKIGNRQLPTDSSLASSWCLTWTRGQRPTGSPGPCTPTRAPPDPASRTAPTSGGVGGAMTPCIVTTDRWSRSRRHGLSSGAGQAAAPREPTPSTVRRDPRCRPDARYQRGWHRRAASPPNRQARS